MLEKVSIKTLFRPLLILAIVSVLLAACGEPAGAPTDTQKNTTTQSAAAAPTQAAVQEKPVKIMWSFSEDAPDMERVKTFIEEQSGVKFTTKILQSGNFENAVNVSLASSEDIDVISYYSGPAPYRSLLQRNALMRINELLEKYGQSILKVYKEEAWECVNDKDKNIYGIPSHDREVGYVIAIRKDWREKLGMDPITTFGEFEQYLRALKDSDFDNNGKKDTIPLTGYYKISYLNQTVSPLFTDTYGGQNHLSADNKITPLYLHPKYKEYLETLAKWSKEGILHQDLFTVQKAQIDDLIIANRVGAVACWYSNYIRPLEKLKQVVPDADYEFIMPKTLSGRDYKLSVECPYVPGASIVYYSKNAEWAIKLYNWMLSSQENMNVGTVGRPDVDWKYADKEKGIIEFTSEKAPLVYLNQMTYAPWLFTLKTGDFVKTKYNEAYEFYEKHSDQFFEIPDWFVVYNWRGTPIETSETDALALIQENIARIVTDEIPVSEWDRVIAEYRKMYADKYIELATQEYNNQKR